MSWVGIYAKNWPNDMGVKTGPCRRQGVQKRHFPSFWVVCPYKNARKPLLTMKMVDSGLENKPFSNLRKKTGLRTWRSKQGWGHCKGSKTTFLFFRASAQLHKNHFCPQTSKTIWERVGNVVLSKEAAFIF